MLYLDKLEDGSIYEVKDGDGCVEIYYSELGHWTNHTKGKLALSVEEGDDNLIHKIRTENCTIALDIGELIQLYFALDFLYKHSRLESVNGINKTEVLKFEQVND